MLFILRLVAGVSIFAFAAPTIAAVAPLKASPQKNAQLARSEVLIIRVPQFVARAVRFKAVDETGYFDWTGSDEVHGAFVDFNANKEHTTSVYGDVDSGDTVSFGPSDNCLAPQPNCNRGAKSLSFGIALWEKDWTLTEAFFGGCLPGLVNGHPWYDDGICPGDDLIGRANVSLSQMQLLAALPTVGDVVERLVRLTGGDGTYDVTYRLTRLPDFERSIVIHEPPISTFGISLQVTLESPPSAQKVSLTWSGASGNSVDILRGAALIATTANDGQETDKVPGAGTYQYRVCNSGMTTCSPVVSISVP